jgi:signal peptidase II
MIAGLVLGLDQLTKALVLAHLPLNGPSTPLVPGVVSLTHVHNDGVAFGQLAGGGALLIAMAAAAAVAIVVYRARLLRKHGSLHPLLAVGLALALGGALGNMIDRVRLGKVVDFIDLGWWPIFNVADSAICVGAVLLVAYFLRVHRDDAEPAAAPQPAPSE